MWFTRSVLAQGSGALGAAVPTQLTTALWPGLATDDIVTPALAFLLWWETEFYVGQAGFQGAVYPRIHSMS